jgi:phage gp36-like protein
MTYVSATEFQDFFGEDECLMLTELDNPAATTVNVNLIDAALTDATDEANGYLRGRYTLPLESPPAQLKRWVMQIARYLLNRYDPPKVVVEDYERCLKMLGLVSTGRINLGLDSGDVPTPIIGAPSVVETSVSSESGLFDLEGFR